MADDEDTSEILANMVAAYALGQVHGPNPKLGHVAVIHRAFPYAEP